jgi:hypothetical protein
MKINKPSEERTSACDINSGECFMDLTGGQYNVYIMTNISRDGRPLSERTGICLTTGVPVRFKEHAEVIPLPNAEIVI